MGVNGSSDGEFSVTDRRFNYQPQPQPLLSSLYPLEKKHKTDLHSMIIAASCKRLALSVSSLLLHILIASTLLAPAPCTRGVAAAAVSTVTQYEYVTVTAGAGAGALPTLHVVGADDGSSFLSASGSMITPFPVDQFAALLQKRAPQSAASGTPSAAPVSTVTVTVVRK